MTILQRQAEGYLLKQFPKLSHDRGSFEREPLPQSAMDVAPPPSVDQQKKDDQELEGQQELTPEQPQERCEKGRARLHPLVVSSQLMIDSVGG